MDLIQVKIKPDNNTLKYISMIRKFDKSLSIGEIKDNIEAGEYAVVFDLDAYDDDDEFIQEVIPHEKHLNFLRFIEALEVIGASLSFYHNDELEEKQYIVNWIDTVEEIRQQTEYGHGLERD